MQHQALVMFHLSLMEAQARRNLRVRLELMLVVEHVEVEADHPK